MMNPSNTTTYERPQTGTYQSSIAARTWRNPCLRTISKFLAEFSSASHVPSSRDLDLESLARILRFEKKDKDSLEGRILIIEDLFKDIIQMLGSSLNTDLLFCCISYRCSSVRNRNHKTVHGYFTISSQVSEFSHSSLSPCA